MTRSRAGRMARRFLASALIASLAVSLVAAPVAAVDPGDEPSTAVPIATSEFGSAIDYDTSTSTASPDDPTECDSPDSGLFTGPFSETFWHTFTADADGSLLIDVDSFPDPEAEGYLAILFVFADDGSGGLDPIACSAFPASVEIEVSAGTDYFVMTGSLPELPGGGPTRITILEPFVSEVTIAPDATYDPQTNLVTIHGTLTCDIPADDVFVDVQASQVVGSNLIFGFGGGGAEGGCDGLTEWSATIEGNTSFLNPGRIDVAVSVFACNVICTGDSASAVVRARPINNKPGPEPPPPPPAPENDEREGAFPIALGETAEQDTTGATANETDPADCFPASLATVWYSLTVEADVPVEIDTLASDYDTTLTVLDGDLIVACNDQFEGDQSFVSFEATAGTTYLIMVGAWFEASPGQLVLNGVAGDPPPPPPDPPANDEQEDAIPLVVGGEALEVDTAGATVNLATDPQECPFAGFPPSTHTVWYSLTVEADGFIEINTLDSDFDTTLYVIDAAGEVVACNDDAVEVASRVVFEASAGETFHVMVGSFANSDGGMLVVRAVEGSPPLEFDFTVDPAGTVDPHTGIATIGGTLSCSEPATGFVFVDATQGGGRFLVVGNGGAEITCTPETTTWSVQVEPFNGRFQTGGLAVFVDASVGTEDGQFDGFFVEDTIRVRATR